MFAMSKLRAPLLAACFAAALPGCNRPSGPPPIDFALVGQRPAKAKEQKNTLEEAKAACHEEAKRKGIKSVLAIFRGFQRGATEEDFVECMKKRGYEPTQ